MRRSNPLKEGGGDLIWPTLKPIKFSKFSIRRSSFGVLYEKAKLFFEGVVI